MTFRFLIWIAVLFLLVLPLASAFPYSPASNIAPDNAFIKTGNESFDNKLNWSSDASFIGVLNITQGTEALYIPELIGNPNTNSLNWTLFQARIRVLSTSDNNGRIFDAYPQNNTITGSTYTLELVNREGEGMKLVDGQGTSQTFAGWREDGTTQDVKVVIKVGDSAIKCSAILFVNDTQAAVLENMRDPAGAYKCPHFLEFQARWYGFQVDMIIEGGSFVSYNGSIYNMSGAAPIIPDPDEQQFTITATDTYDAESLKNITITIFNSSNSYDFTTGNGTILVSNKTSLESFNVTYDVRFFSNQSGGYLNHTIPNINLSNGGSFIGDLYQAILRINATKKIDRSILSDFFVSVPLQSNQSNSSGFATLLLKAGNYNVTGNKTGYLNSTSSISINALDDAFLTLEFATHRLRIDARDKFSNETISSFNVTITGLDITHSETKSTTTGNISFDIEAGDFSVDIFGNDNYALESGNVSVDTTFTNHTFLLFPRNSILITVYEEGTSTQIGNIGVTDNRTTTADFDSTLQVLNLSSANGTILAESIQPTNYLITVGSAGFDSRQYFITLNPDSHVGLNAYLINITDTSSITFTVKDISDQKELPNIRISVSDKINLTYVTIDQKDTDIAGQAVFDLDQTKTYRFTMSGTGYETRTFDLKPITTAYTIELTPFAKIDFTTIFNSVDFVTLPVSSIIINTTDLINFSIITTSLTGITIKHFGLNTTYLGVLSLTNVSGSAGGGTASIFLNLSNMTGSVGVTYFIDIDGEIPFILNREFLVTNLTKVNQSMEVTLKDFSKQIGQPIGAIVGTIFIILIMATFASMGLRDRRMNVIGALALGFVAFQYGFFGEITATSMTAYLIGAVMLGLMITYFIGGMRSEDD